MADLQQRLKDAGIDVDERMTELRRSPRPISHRRGSSESLHGRNEDKPSEKKLIRHLRSSRRAGASCDKASSATNAVALAALLLFQFVAVSACSSRSRSDVGAPTANAS